MIISGVLIALLMLVFILFSRLITTFVHEMGHAIPALLFTDQRVVVYVGSYHDISRSLLLSSGRLSVYFTFNVFGWDLGLCRHSRAESIREELTIVLGGPLASLLFGIFLLGVARNWGLSDGHITLLAVFIFSSIWDFFVNIYPRKNPIYLHDGSMTLNDGQQIMNLLRLQQQPEALSEAIELMKVERYEVARQKLQGLVEEGYQKPIVYDLILEALIQEEHFEAARDHVDEHFYGRTLDAHDYATIGKIYSGLKNFEEALKYYNFSIHLRFNDPTVLNQRGFALMQLGEHDMAFKDFDAAINYHNTYADAYLNRGMVKIHMGYLEDGEVDLRQGLSINTEHPLGYLYMGQLQEKKHNFREALKAYEKAKELGVKHHGLEFYIAEARRALNYE